MKMLAMKEEVIFSSIHNPLETGGVDRHALPVGEGLEGGTQDNQAGREGTPARSLSCSF